MLEDSQREFSDRSIRELLQKPENLRELLEEALPDHADRFDVERMKPAPAEFLLGNWRRRAPDVMVEIPYRTEIGELTALVCVLVEHVTNAAWQIPLKTFQYAAQYWEWQWRTWEEAAAPKPEFSLSPVVPIVLHTGLRPWGSARTLRDLFGPPEGLHLFVPDWQPLFWELSKHSTDELLRGEHVFLQALAIFKADDAELEEARQLFVKINERINQLPDSRRVRWENLLHLLIGWAHNRRPKSERQSWRNIVANLETDADRRKEIDRMAITIEQSIYLEGRLEGRQEGRQEESRRLLLKFGKKRFGPPSEAVVLQLEGIDDLDRLDRMSERLDSVGSWEDLSETL